MRSLNRITLLGHVVGKPELRQTKSGKAVAQVVVATNNEWLDSDGQAQKSVDFHRVVLWEKLAEVCHRHLEKGTPVYLEGRLTTRRYEGQDKTTHYVMEIVAQAVNILKWASQKKTVEVEELATA